MTYVKTTLPILTAALLLAAGCVSDGATRLSLGGQCELSSECQAPLVCRLERCRRECISTRDCALGLRCVKAEDGLGVCQLPEERTCALDSECVPPLVCRTESCVNDCADDRDCPAAQRCDAETSSCVEINESLCTYHSDCPEPYVCNARQQCQVECAEDRDCGSSLCIPHEACNDMPCMCRTECTDDTQCPYGFECVACPAGLECGEGVESYCERIPD